MKIMPLQSTNVNFKGQNEREDSSKNTKIAVLTGGAGGTALTTSVSKLNRTAIAASKGTVKAKSSFGSLTKNAETFSEGIFRCIKNFATSLHLNKLPGLKPMDRILKSTFMRRTSGILGGAIAFATTIFGLVETGAIFSELVKK